MNSTNTILSLAIHATYKVNRPVGHVVALIVHKKGRMRGGINLGLGVLGRRNDMVGYLILQIRPHHNQIGTVEGLMIGKVPNVAVIHVWLAKVNARPGIQAVAGHIVAIQAVVRQVKSSCQRSAVDAEHFVIVAGQVGGTDELDGATEKVGRWHKHIGAAVFDCREVVGGNGLGDWTCRIGGQRGSRE